MPRGCKRWGSSSATSVSGVPPGARTTTSASSAGAVASVTMTGRRSGRIIDDFERGRGSCELWGSVQGLLRGGGELEAESEGREDRAADCSDPALYDGRSALRLIHPVIRQLPMTFRPARHIP